MDNFIFNPSVSNYNNIFFYITEVHINGYKIVAYAILLAHYKLQDDKITIFVTCTSILD